MIRNRSSHMALLAMMVLLFVETTKAATCTAGTHGAKGETPCTECVYSPPCAHSLRNSCASPATPWSPRSRCRRSSTLRDTHRGAIACSRSSHQPIHFCRSSSLSLSSPSAVKPESTPSKDTLGVSPALLALFPEMRALNVSSECCRRGPNCCRSKPPMPRLQRRF